MGLFKNKELEQLRDENEELKTQLHFIAEKQENARYLEELLKKLRKEVSQLNNEKNIVQEKINFLNAEEHQKQEQLSEFQRRIESLGDMKDELQNTILSYSGKVEGLENLLNSEQQIEDNSDSDDQSSSSEPNAESEKYILEANERIKALNEQESELLNLIELRKEVFPLIFSPCIITTG